MKQLRCILSVLCAICIVICAVSGTVTVFAADEFIIQDGILTAYTGISESVVIPDGVKIIGSNAFKGNKTVTSVTIPYGVKTIGDSAFFVVLHGRRRSGRRSLDAFQMHLDGSARRHLRIRGSRQLAVISAVSGHRIGGRHADAWSLEEKSYGIKRI